MKVLGIETSGYCGSVAVTDDETLIGECLVNSGPRHSERLMLMIDWLLGELEIGRHEIDAVAVSTGPGSFTSLRVGLGIAKGMVYSLGIRISGVSSLDTLAAGVMPSDRSVCPVIDARRGEVYSKILGKGFNKTEIMEERVVSLDELCSSISEDTVFVGEGAKQHADIIRDKLGDRAAFAPPLFDLPRASSMCYISYHRLIKGIEDNVFTLVPNYIRKSSADKKVIK